MKMCVLGCYKICQKFLNLTNHDINNYGQAAFYQKPRIFCYRFEHPCTTPILPYKTFIICTYEGNVSENYLIQACMKLWITWN